MPPQPDGQNPRASVRPAGTKSALYVGGQNPRASFRPAPDANGWRRFPHSPNGLNGPAALTDQNVVHRSVPGWTKTVCIGPPGALVAKSFSFRQLRAWTKIACMAPASRPKPDRPGFLATFACQRRILRRRITRASSSSRAGEGPKTCPSLRPKPGCMAPRFWTKAPLHLSATIGMVAKTRVHRTLAPGPKRRASLPAPWTKIPCSVPSAKNVRHRLSLRNRCATFRPGRASFRPAACINPSDVCIAAPKLAYPFRVHGLLERETFLSKTLSLYNL